MPRAKLTRIAVTKTPVGPHQLRTNEIRGWFSDAPEESRSFVFYSQPIDTAMSIRQIITSPVRAVRHRSNSVTEFMTDNSSYVLEVYGDENP